VPGSSKSVGIRVALPFEQDVNAFVTEDIDIPRCVADADEAIAVLREHRERWLGESGARRGDVP